MGARIAVFLEIPRLGRILALRAHLNRLATIGIIWALVGSPYGSGTPQTATLLFLWQEQSAPRLD